MEGLPWPAGVIVAFAAGVTSFLSPCVLPLVPSYLSYISGMSLDDLEAGVDRRSTLLHAVLFVAGFSTVFILLGATASFLGQFLRLYEVWVLRVGGALLIVFGLHLVGALRVAGLLRERRVHFHDKPSGHIGTVLVGMAFAAGWTPCLTPVLSSILTLAGTSDQVGSGIVLLGAYSGGLGLPLIAAAVGLERFLAAFQRFRRHMHIVQVVAGGILIVLGLLLITGSLTVLTAYLYRLTPPFLLDFEEWMLGRGA